MFDWYKDKVPEVNDAYEKGLKNCQMLSHHIKKDLTKACAEKVTAIIMCEIGNRNFSMLIDESRDVSIKEQMGVILRFVNDEGKVMERFLGLQHIERCTAIALKEALFDDLSRALQRKDQDIVEAMSLLIDVKELLQDMRENGWKPLLNRVISFGNKHEIKVPKMDKEVNERGTSTRRRHNVTNKHYYHVEIYLAAIDAILVEMNHHFSEVSSELLVCMSSLNPRNSFSNFDVDKLVRLAEIYAEDFLVCDLMLLRTQLGNFISKAH
ncbi:uncharacterized protein LOC127779553 isoform X2 [Oryza glaberrima]|uniref:uncharacterized protein LOC127779553 isoform X2 n=1 Tax=Oryza glaberrima TaxID=4538 RepID=UPI00224BE7EB|nr:uncharacterized protein LOC127779553 isoform X2 [Oryza glaberrima]